MMTGVPKEIKEFEYRVGVVLEVRAPDRIRS